jgi:adenylate cyclase
MQTAMNASEDQAEATSARRKAAVIDWLLTEGRRAESAARLADAFAERLTAEGLPLWRLFFGLPVLHPLVRFLSVYWRDDRDGVDIVRREHGTEQQPGYLSSPIAAILDQDADALRFRIERLEAPLPHPILDELRAEGGSDYVIMALHFGAGRNGVVSLATKRPGGFSTCDLALADGVRDALAAVLESLILKKLAATVVETYVGSRAGERVLSGEIRRGSLETVSAVLWYCDLRGFTGLSDRLAPPDLIALLNGYFEIIGGAVEAHGGEVLKFIGDAVLAIFPFPAGGGDPQGGSAAAACTVALAAARQAVRDMAARNVERSAWGEPILRCGIALHLGEVLYGNIGAPTRLDFTVIGQAVNLVTRIEGLCKRLDRTVLTSDAFAASAEEPLLSLGWHPVRGLLKPVEVYGLADPEKR